MSVNSQDSDTYLRALRSTIMTLVPHQIDDIAATLLDAYANDRSVFVFGNGGSAATASHFACDLGKGATQWLGGDARRFRVIALTDNAAVLTAWANDCEYEDVFAEQLRNLVRSGDVVIAISASGNSPNVLKALHVARAAGARTIGFTGFNGGQMKDVCRQCLVIPSSTIEIVEDLHLALCHSVTTVIRSSLTRMRSDDIFASSDRSARGDFENDSAIAIRNVAAAAAGGLGSVLHDRFDAD